jgi:hypothetical protein
MKLAEFTAAWQDYARARRGDKIKDGKKLAAMIDDLIDRVHVLEKLAENIPVDESMIMRHVEDALNEGIQETIRASKASGRQDVQRGEDRGPLHGDGHRQDFDIF